MPLSAVAGVQCSFAGTFVGTGKLSESPVHAGARNHSNPANTWNCSPGQSHLRKGLRAVASIRHDTTAALRLHILGSSVEIYVPKGLAKRESLATLARPEEPGCQSRILVVANSVGRASAEASGLLLFSGLFRL